MAKSIKCNITIDGTLLDQIDSYASSMHMSRSGFLALAAQSYMTSKDMLPSIQGLISSVSEAVSKVSYNQMTLDDFNNEMARIEKERMVIGSKAGLIK